MENTKAQESPVNVLEVLNKLTSKALASNMPPAQLLNAPGNEELRAIPFTPVKDKAALKGEKMGGSFRFDVVGNYYHKRH